MSQTQEEQRTIPEKNLTNLKLLLELEGNDRDDILSLLWEKVEQWIRDYCNIKELSQELTSVTEDLTVIRYNKLGSEGLASEGVGPLSMTYDDLPVYIQHQLSKYKALGW